jgi:hypothetical protein
MSEHVSGRGVVLCMATLLVPLLSGCIAINEREHYNKPTLGRQLMDLKTARDTGAISETEYNAAKEGLIQGRASSDGFN